MPTPTYVPLGTITLASTDSEIVFSSIPATYRDLIVVANLSRDNVSSTDSYMKLNTSTANFSNVQMFGNGSVTAATRGSDGRIATYQNTTSRRYSVIFQIMDYSATDKHKTILSRYNGDNSGVGAFALRWAQTTAVNSLSVYVTSGNYQAGSTFSLYGVN